jgi:hypothetical protein
VVIRCFWSPFSYLDEKSGDIFCRSNDNYPDNNVISLLQNIVAPSEYIQITCRQLLDPHLLYLSSLETLTLHHLILLVVTEISKKKYFNRIFGVNFAFGFATLMCMLNKENSTLANIRTYECTCYFLIIYLSLLHLSQAPSHLEKYAVRRRKVSRM